MYTVKKLRADDAKLSRIALERNAEARAEFSTRIGQYQPDQIVFVDESSVDRRTPYRGAAWSLKGTRATRKAFFCRGRRFGCVSSPFF